MQSLSQIKQILYLIPLKCQISRIKKSMYFPEDLKNTSITYMIYQVVMPLHYDRYIQYKDLYWRSLHSNHLHHSYTLEYWLHHCSNCCQSKPVEPYNPDLQSRCIPCNIVYWRYIHSNHHHQSDTLDCL